MTKILIAVLLLVTGVAATESSVRAGGSNPSDYVDSSSTLNQRHVLNSVRYQLDNPKQYGVPRHFLGDKSVRQAGRRASIQKENDAETLTDASAEELHKWVSSFRAHKSLLRN